MSRVSKGIWGMAFFLAVLLVLAAMLFFALSVPAVAETAPIRLPIWMYHDVVTNDSELGDYAVSAEQLKTDLSALKEAGWQSVSLSEVIGFVHNAGTLPERPVLLVFDDGYRSVLTEVIPLLEQYDMRAVVSVIGARAEQVWDGCDTTDQYMNWEELGQAVASGRIELQSHSANLHVYRTRKGLAMLPDEREEDYAALLLADMRTMEDFAKDTDLPLARSFAYPYGYVEPLADGLFQQQGYLITMTSEPHINVLTQNANCLYRMGRLNRSGNISTEEMIAWMNSLYE